MEKPTEYTLTWEVTDEMTAKRIGSAGSKILSTPNMVALMEADHGRPQGDPGEGGAEEGLIPGLWGAPSKTDGVSRPFLMAGRQRPDRLSPGENLEVLKILALAS